MEDKSAWSVTSSHLLVLLPIAVLCGVAAWLFLGVSAPAFVPDAPTKALSLLGTLLLVALFVERSIEVYVGALRSQDIAKLDAELSEARKGHAAVSEQLAARRAAFTGLVELASKKEASSASTMSQINEDNQGVVRELLEKNRHAVEDLNYRLDVALQAVNEAVAAREKCSGDTRRTALLGAVFLGICVATVGPRILTEMTEPVDDLEGLRRWIFVTVDVFITGGLIGGGSDGIHKIISLATEKLDQVKRGIRSAV